MSKKFKKTPFYTDRIFYFSRNNYSAELIDYDSVESQIGSTHKPVFSKLKIDLKQSGNLSSLLALKSYLKCVTLVIEKLDVGFFMDERSLQKLLGSKINLKKSDVVLKFKDPFNLLNRPISSSKPILEPTGNGALQSLTWTGMITSAGNKSFDIVLSG